MWDDLGPGIELMFPALAGRFFTIEPPGKPQDESILNLLWQELKMSLFAQKHGGLDALRHSL